MSVKTLAAIALTVAAAASPALAESSWYSPKSDGDWLIRLRGLSVLPNETVTVDQNAAAGGKIDTSVVPELDITYFFTKNIAAELILGVTPHDVKATGVTVPGALDNATIDLGDVTLLPPTLTVQYHFVNDSQWKPYVGAGVNATFFFDEDQGPVADGIDYDTSVGLALQAGVDYDLDGEPGGWAINADIKKIWINPDVTVDFTTALGATVDADVDINPLVVGLGLGYKF